DKTGTLTQGRPELVNLTPLNGFAEDEVLVLVASAERNSEHPLAQAVVRAAEKRGLPLRNSTGFQSFTGTGIQATVEARPVIVGNEKLFSQLHLPLDGAAERADQLRRSGQTVALAAIGGRPAALLGIADPIKPTTPEALQALRAEGIQVIMLTGDS